MEIGNAFGGMSHSMINIKQPWRILLENRYLEIALGVEVVTMNSASSLKADK